MWGLSRRRRVRVTWFQFRDFLYVQDYYTLPWLIYTLLSSYWGLLVILYMLLSEAVTDRPKGLFSVCWLNPVFAVSAGFRELDRWALAGERVRLPADQPEAVRPASGADRLGGTPGLLPLRPFPDWQWETELQVRVSLEGWGGGT